MISFVKVPMDIKVHDLSPLTFNYDLISEGTASYLKYAGMLVSNTLHKSTHYSTHAGKTWSLGIPAVICNLYLQMWPLEHRLTQTQRVPMGPCSSTLGRPQTSSVVLPTRYVGIAHHS